MFTGPAVVEMFSEVVAEMDADTASAATGFAFLYGDYWIRFVAFFLAISHWD